jgi:hypothetical protein
MTKFIITLTDRSHNAQLDLRKEKLSTLNQVGFFKIDEGGNISNYEYTMTYFGTSSIQVTLRRFLENRLSTNREGSGIFSNYVSKSQLDSFIKFAKKHGKVIEVFNLDSSFLDVLNSFLEEEKTLLSQIKELENSFTKINYLDSKGRYRKINYKCIIIKTNPESSYSQNQIYISDDHTNITHVMEGSYSCDMKLKEKCITYYGYYNLGGSIFTILKAGKRGREKYLDLMKQLSDLNEKRRKAVLEYILNLFK